MYRKTSSPQTLRKLDYETSWKAPSTVSREGLTNNTEWNDDPSKPPPIIEDSLNNPKKVTYTNDAFICDIDIPIKKLTSVENGDGLPYSPDNNGEGNAQHFGENFLRNIRQSIRSHTKDIKLFFKVALFLLYNVYFAFAIYSTWDEASSFCDGIKFLTVITAMAYFFAFYSYVFKAYMCKRLRPCLRPLVKSINKLFLFSWLSRVVWSALWGAVIIFLILDTYDDRYRLVSAAGLTVFIFLGYVFSKHRRKIIWRHLLWGIFIQFCIGLLILRWSVGKDIFRCLGDKVKGFLDVTDKGSSFVFGYLVTGSLTDAALQPAIFAFKVLSVIIFFSFIVSLLYYYGVMQVLVMKVGWLLQHTIGTTACESMNAAANIFLGMTEAPLLIRPYLPLMTKSEIHAVMTGGFATIAGSVLAAYINFGINASHLLSASVMAAPAALAFSKLVYPETEESKTQASSIKIEKGTESNALEAATNGASTAIKLVSNIAANLIAFVAFIALLDTVLSWLGSLIHWNFLSFEWVLSKLFIPASLLMGVDWDDKEKVANLVGLKMVVNEFVAYKRLADYQKDNQLSARSEAIATYALCGFSNISSIGIQIGALSAMAPNRKSDFAQIALRAMITGTATCFLNACVAGTLLQQ